MVLPNKSVIVTVCIGFSTFICSYILCSGMLFLFDFFSVIKALILSFIIITICTILYYMKGNKSKVIFDFGKHIYLLFAISMMINCVIVQFGFFGMGQDEGCYQTQALFFLNGFNNIEYTFQEFYNLEQAEQESYKEFLALMVNFYNTDFMELGVDIGSDEATGVFHGLPTAPAIYALSASIFGVAEMSLINMFIYICAMLLLYMTCLKANMPKIVSTVVMLMTALSPIILWVAKSTLTEIILTLLVVMHLYFLVGEPEKVFYSLLPIFAFSFYHCSIYIFIPMYVGIYLFLYLRTKKREYAISAIMAAIAFAVGYYMMLKIALYYTVYNSVHILFGFLPWKILYAVPVLAVLITIVSVLLIKKAFMQGKFSSKDLARLDNSKTAKCLLRIILVVSLIGLIYCLFTCWNYSSFNTLYSKIDKMHKNIGFTPTAAYCLTTGVFLYPIAFIYIFFKPEKFLRSKYIVITIEFVYIVLIVNVFFRQTLPYYYYFCRYLAYSIPLVIIIIALSIEEIFNKKLVTILFFMGIVQMWPSISLLITTQDDTRMEWDVLIAIAESIPNETAVLFEKDQFAQISACAIKAMTGADIYPIEENLDFQAEKLSSIYSSIYLIKESYDELDYEVIYRDTYIESNDDNLSYRKPYSPAPYNFVNRTHMVTVYNICIER